MTVQLRPATPADVPTLARIQLLAARSQLPRGLYDVMMDQPDGEILRFLEQLLQTETRSWAHYSTYLVAEVDGQAAAGLCAYDPREHGLPVLEQAIGEALTGLGWAEAEQAALWQRFAPLATCFPPDEAGAWVIEAVATLPAFRRRGLIDALLREALERGRGQGHAFAQLTAFIGNTPALRAYEKVGFTAVREQRHPDFAAAMGIPGTVRMFCPLA